MSEYLEIFRRVRTFKPGTACNNCPYYTNCAGINPEAVPKMMRALIHMLQAADCSWEEKDLGHDWREAVKEARAALAKAKEGQGGCAHRLQRRDPDPDA